MSTSSWESSTPPLAVQQQIDGVCLAFENAWLTGSAPSLSDFVARIDPEHRRPLLVELFRLDREYRRAGGLPCGESYYCDLFPEETPLVEAALCEARAAEAAEKTPVVAGPFESTVGASDAGAFFSSARRFGGVVGGVVGEAREGALESVDSPARYRVTHLHARGGMGEVFVASDEQFSREVALKQIQTPYADRVEARQRFLREAAITARLQHPGITPVYSQGLDAAGRPFYAMKLIQGETLAQVISRRQSAAGETASNVARQSPGFRDLLRRMIAVCETIQYAHDREVVHRDIKPSNILLGKYGETLVVDWGLARRISGPEERAPEERAPEESGDLTPLDETNGAGPMEISLTGQLLGTPAYMSPEQARGERELIRTASDIYSLGATLYAVLTGEPPVTGTDTEEVLRRVGSGDYREPRRVRQSVPRPLSAICAKAMAFAPEDRYRSASALAADLEHWLADEPVAAYADPFVTRAARTMRRRVGMVAGAAGVLITAIFALAAIALLTNQQNQALQAARQEAVDQGKFAQNERDQHDAALDFFVASFRSADPSRQGREATVVEAMDAAFDSVRSPQADPDLKALGKASILSAIGRTYHELGEYEKASQALELGAELAVEALGEQADLTTELWNNLANAYAQTGRLDDAIELHEKILAVRQSKLGERDLVTMETAHNLAVTFRRANRDLDRAASLLGQVVDVREANHGAADVNTLRAKTSLATVYNLSHRERESIELLVPVLAACQKELGADDLDTIYAAKTLADAYRASGQTDEAIQVLAEIAAQTHEKVGEDHPDLLDLKIKLAHLYSNRSEWEPAIRWAQEAYDLRRARLGDDRESAFNDGLILAKLYLGGDRPQDAEQVLQGLIDRLSQNGSSNELLLAAASLEMGACLVRQNEWARAEPSLRESLSYFEKAPALAMLSARAKLLLGQALAGQKNVAEAEPLLLAGYEELAQLLASAPPAQRTAALQEAAASIARVFDAIEENEEANAWRDRAPE